MNTQMKFFIDLIRRSRRRTANDLAFCLAVAILIFTFSGKTAAQKSTDKWRVVPSPAAERYRVTMTGFTVNRQSNDNVLESDGKGDEVYVVADIAQYDNHWLLDRQRFLGHMNDLITQPMGTPNRYHGRGNITLRNSYESILMGDVGNEQVPRVIAGTAGDNGGLRTGDRFPTNEPWNIRARATRPNRLPMVLWEGSLRPADLVIILPTIWEWDGGNARMRSTYSQAVSHYFSTGTYRDSGFTWLGMEGADVFGAGDRPIGMLNSTWVPQGIFLTDELARYAASGSPSRVAPGVIEVRYTAESEDYSLYFKVERVSQ